MGIALDETHVDLAGVARGLLSDRKALQQHRDMLDDTEEALPQLWDELARIGWLGLHLSADVGGSGYGIAELAVVIEELGRVVAPGPFLPTVLVSALVDRYATEAERSSLLPGLADGSRPAGIGTGGALVAASGALSGDAGVVLSAQTAMLLALAHGDDMVLVESSHPGVTVTPAPSLDRGRRVGRVSLEAVPESAIIRLPGAVTGAVALGRTLAAAEAAGGAAACVEMSADYAKHRIAFGRPIGQFQAVKHHCADMFAQAELATAVAWDAARFADDPAQASLASSVAAAVALPAMLFCARRTIQVHGGLGFTWDHDAHLYLRRAMSLLALFGPLEQAREQVLAAELDGGRAVTHLDVSPPAPELRARLQEFRAEYESLPEDQRIGALIGSGFLVPHWPPPWGRGATPEEQVVIDEELAGIPRSPAGGWLALTLSAAGTPDQQRRWVRPALEGSIQICQLFSEPDAGSDLASLRTRAERGDGGWVVTGQKVWTSGAMTADWGFALVRTDPGLEKHAGLTVMMIPMDAPGLERRGLRQITGDAHFAQVFLDGVFVPDSDVIGEINGGWAVARQTMGNERTVIGSTITHVSLDLLLGAVADRVGGQDPIRQEVGAIVSEHYALSVLDLRRGIRALSGSASGAEGNVTKLLGNELDQRLTEVAMRILGPDGAAADGEFAPWAYQFLFTRAYTLGGGTSEISRNAIGERILGLPRDPKPGQAVATIPQSR